jgi:hypothetical protein
VALTVVVVLIAVMWIWIYFWAPRDNPDRLTSRGFATDAEAICAPAQEAVDALPIGTTATTPEERARQVEAGTTITIGMVAELEAAAEQVTDPSDRRILDAWFEDWHNYIEDRQAHVVKLDAADADTSDRDLAFTLRELASGGTYTRRIDGLANVNDMTSCHVPGDV